MADTQPESAMALCTACGLCCSGAIFNQLKLHGPELQEAFMFGMNVVVDENGPGLSFPCTKLDDTRCMVYDRRPHGCRHYACELLKGVEAGAIPLAAGLEKVAAARAAHVALLEVLDGETIPAFRTRRADAWFDRGEVLPPSPALDRLLALDHILDEHFRRPEQNMTKPFEGPPPTPAG